MKTKFITRKKKKTCGNCAFFLFSLDRRKRKRHSCNGDCVWGTTTLPASVKSTQKWANMSPLLSRDDCPVWKDILEITPNETKDVELIVYSDFDGQKQKFVLKNDGNVYFEGGQNVYLESDDICTSFRQLFTLMDFVLLDGYRITKIKTVD